MLVANEKFRRFVWPIRSGSQLRFPPLELKIREQVSFVKVLACEHNVALAELGCRCSLVA